MPGFDSAKMCQQKLENQVSFISAATEIEMMRSIAPCDGRFWSLSTVYSFSLQIILHASYWFRISVRFCLLTERKTTRKYPIHRLSQSIVCHFVSSRVVRESFSSLFSLLLHPKNVSQLNSVQEKKLLWTFLCQTLKMAFFIVILAANTVKYVELFFLRLSQPSHKLFKCFTLVTALMNILYVFIDIFILAHKCEMWRVSSFQLISALWVFMWMCLFAIVCVCECAKVERKIKTRKENFFFGSAIHQFLLWPSCYFGIIIKTHIKILCDGEHRPPHRRHTTEHTEQSKRKFMYFITITFHILFRREEILNNKSIFGQNKKKFE